VLQSMEQGPSFRIVKPKFPVEDPSWRKTAPQRSRYTHLYFHLIDEVLGPFAMRIGAYLPFYATYYLNGHDIIAIERPDNRYVYTRSDYGRKAAAMLVIVRNRILRPIAGSLFDRPVQSSLKPSSTLHAQYRKTTRSFNELIALLKAA
jgi:hypothetical protein